MLVRSSSIESECHEKQITFTYQYDHVSITLSVEFIERSQQDEANSP